MTDPISQIKAELERINEARAKATPYEWITHWQSQQEDSYDIYSVKENEDSVYLVTAQEVCQSDAEFIALAANEILNLTKALSVAVERIERFQAPCTRADYTVGQLDKVVCEMADDAIKSIAEILSGGGDGK